MLTKINWNPTSRDIRKFGITLIIGFSGIGSIFFLTGHRQIAFALWGTSAGVGLFALLSPAVAKPLYRVWMAIAFLMGTIFSTLVLVIIFYLIITPIGLFMRLFGRDALKLKKESFAGGTYWNTLSNKGEKKSYYERLY